MSRPTLNLRRPTLAARIALVTTAAAVVTVLVAGLVMLPLVRSAARADARATLSRLADALVDPEPVPVTTTPLRTAVGLRGRLLRAARVQFTLLGPRGAFLRLNAAPFFGDPLARAALSPAERRAVVAGRSLSLVRKVDGGSTLIEARPTVGGGEVLVQAERDATPLVAAVFRRTVLALLVGLGVAVAAGVVLARLLARPLRRAASAARALALGAREVQVTPEGPAEVAEVAEALNLLASALRHSEGRQREFLLSVSHELRTPLTAISGFAESLADQVITGAEVPAAGQTMLAEARRLERLVRDLLDLARLGAQDFRIDLQAVDLVDLAGRAGQVWRVRCEAVGVRFGMELPDHPVITLTDPTRVRQIVDGLAENALRVTPAGAPIVLAVGADETAWPPLAVLQVRDGGPGLTEADCLVAFGRSVLYERYRGVRQVGTGVGLALVHGLTIRMGGTASAGRAPEGGACFTVRLPLADPATAAADTVPISTLYAGTGGPHEAAPRDR